jgi:alcohol dehydrogenase class IV
MDIQTFAFPTQIHFGPGARRGVAKHLANAGVRRPLIVTDKGLAALPLVGEFKELIETDGLEAAVFGGVFGNPTAQQAQEGADAFRQHRADAVIGLGGGAALDVAKMVCVLATHQGNALEFAWDHPRSRPIEKPLPYFIALPTTSGTGSEVGRSAVISDDETHVKRIIFNPKLLARAVFADPELTLELPAKITAATGMDALTHNVESYLSPAYHPLCDGIALEGARIAARSLERAVQEGKDIKARSEMMMSSLMGGIAFQKDLGAVHSCAHALGAVCDLHHGLANGVMIDHVMRFNTGSAPEKFAELARVCGAGSNGADFVRWLTGLKQRVGIPDKLGAVGVKQTHVERLVAVAIEDPCHKTNPRACNREDFQRMFAEAL